MDYLPITLIIPTHNRVQKLTRLLCSLTKLSPKPKEILIINDGSNDGTRDLLALWESKNHFLEKKVINLVKPKGPANARNLGIIQASQEIVAFTDDDVIVESNWLSKLYWRLINSKKKLVCGVGGRVLSLHDDILNQYYEDQRILEPPKKLQYLVTVNAMLQKSLLLKTGLFDTSFTYAGGEDTELSLRLRKDGYNFEFEPEAIIYHDFSPNFIDFCKMWIRYGRGTKHAIMRNK